MLLDKGECSSSNIQVKYNDIIHCFVDLKPVQHVNIYRCPIKAFKSLYYLPLFGYSDGGLLQYDNTLTYPPYQIQVFTLNNSVIVFAN